MKNKIIALLIITQSLFLITAFKLKKQGTAKVLIYGAIYKKECGAEVIDQYITDIINVDDYFKQQQKMETELKTKYPDKKIKVSSSKFDYGLTAKNMCIIQYQKNYNDCHYNVISILFGKTQAEALEKALALKKLWAKKDASHLIIEERTW